MSKPIKMKNAKKSDGWINLLTGMGLKSKDKGRNIQATWEPIPEVEAEQFYSSDEMNARIVDELPEEACRKWIDVKFQDKNITKEIMDGMDGLQVKEKFQEAWSLARLYGGAAVFIGYDDTDDYSKPLRIQSGTKIRFLTVLSRWELTVNEIEGDIRSPLFNEPISYRLSVTGGGKGAVSALNETIHHSRLIRFDGAFLPRRLRITNDYWHDSVFTRVAEALRGYANAHSSSVASLQDFDTPVLKIKNLAELIASGGEAQVRNRVDIMNMCKSVLRMVIIDEEESLDHVGRNLSGTKDLVGKAEDRLVAATNMPRTKLLGESPGGLGSNGKGEDRSWYDFVSRQQEKSLRRPVDRFLDIYLNSKKGPTGGIYPDNLSWGFNPLWQSSELERADIYSKTANADTLYIDRGVLDPDDVRTQRFTPDGFAVDLVIDETLPEDEFNENDFGVVFDSEDVPEGVDTVPPKTVQENAKRALELRDKHNSSAMTPVGIARARDLSNGASLSRSTIAAMSSFARHLGNYDPKKPDDKGTIAVLGWGGPEGIEWAQKKLEEIDRKKSN